MLPILRSKSNSYFSSTVALLFPTIPLIIEFFPKSHYQFLRIVREHITDDFDNWNSKNHAEFIMWLWNSCYSSSWEIENLFVSSWFSSFENSWNCDGKHVSRNKARAWAWGGCHNSPQLSLIFETKTYQQSLSQFFSRECGYQ